MKTGEGEGGIPVTSPQVTLCNSKAGKRRSTFPVQENASRPGAAVDFPLHFLHLQRQLLLVLHDLSFLFGGKKKVFGGTGYGSRFDS
jgi:hypothetical protein